MYSELHFKNLKKYLQLAIFVMLAVLMLIWALFSSMELSLMAILAELSATSTYLEKREII